MSRIEGSYPPPVRGVSTLAPRNRAEGYAGLQENLRSNPVTKLVKRPSTNFGSWISTEVANKVKKHEYRRDDVTYSILSELDNSTLIGRLPTGGSTLTDPYFATVNKELEFVTINDTTIVINPEVEVAMLPDTDESIIENVSYINILSALNYSETIRVNISKGGNQIASVSYAVPALGTATPDYDTADRARSTRQVAFELAQLINSSPISYPNPAYNYDWTVCSPVLIPLVAGPTEYIIELGRVSDTWATNPDYDSNAIQCVPYIESSGGVAGITAQVLGSTVAVWSDDGEWLDLTIETGQGDRSGVAVNRVIEKIDGLPLYAVHGTRIEVRPDPVSEKGRYYLEARGTSDDAVLAPTQADRKLEEVTWVESRSPTEPYKWDTSTLPRAVTFVGTGLTALAPLWEERKVGDDETNPPPDFLGKTIRSGGYFQKRLVLLSSDTVTMSETENLYNMWRKSAVKLTVDDRLALASSLANTDKLEHVVAHNRDLLVTSSTNQFKVDGNTAVTAETGSLQLTASFENTDKIKPISIGNSVYFAISYGDSVGIQEYTGQQNTQQDTANQLSRHITGYIPGECKRLVGNANLGMLVVLTEGTPSNEMFVYEQHTDLEGNRTQAAWSKWILPESVELEDISFDNSVLNILAICDGVLVSMTVDMVDTEKESIYLDKKIVGEINTFGGRQTLLLPSNYIVTDDVIVVTGTGTNTQFTKVSFTVEEVTSSKSLIVLDEDQFDGTGTANIVVGIPYKSRYSPTRPYRRDEKGVTVTSDKLRISKYVLNVQDTVNCGMRITSPYQDDHVEEFNSRIVGGIGNLIGKITPYTGDVEFSYGDDPDTSDVEFYSDDYLGFNILGISWAGQYTQTSGRM